MKRCIPLLGLLFLASTAAADVYRLVDDPRQAAQIRVDLIQQAHKEVDALYFLARNDRITRTALALLRDASRRGVKVRLIVDANFNHVPQEVLAHLDDEGVEVRVYHSLTFRHPTWLFRRMHDKVVVVDGEMYVAGGRNLDEAYFGLRKKKNYVDRDVFVKGASAAEAQAHFERLWTSRHVAEIHAGVSARDREKASALLDRERSRLEQSGFVRFDTGKDWAEGEATRAPVRFLHDPINDGDSPRVAVNLIELLSTATTSIVIESPYLIPSAGLLELLEKKIDEGVTIRILTNSMKSTDGLLPQVAYLRYRHHLVRAGMELHEYKGPDTLHAKSVVVDGKIAMVGSYNVDPRSENLNTEVMCVADDPAAAAKLLEAIDVHIGNAWKISSNGRPPRNQSYPRITRMMAFRIWTTRLFLPFIEGQL